MLAYQLVDNYIQDLYSYTYWGNFDVNESSKRHVVNGIIIKNRDDFIYKYDIKEHINRPVSIGSFVSFGLNSKMKQFFDHVEIYKNKNNEFVLITNPYNYNISYYRESIFMENFGFNKIYNMYSPDSNTYIKIGKEHDFLFSVDDFNSVIV